MGLSPLLLFCTLYFYNEKKVSKNAFSSCVTLNISFYCILVKTTNAALYQVSSLVQIHQVLTGRLLWVLHHEGTYVDAMLLEGLTTLLLRQCSTLLPPLNCACLLLQDTEFFNYK